MRFGEEATLWVSIIDTLAGLRYKTRQNRERFMLFVEEHGSWSEGALVSIPFLRDKLDKLELLQCALGQYVTAKLNAFSTEDGGVLPVSRIDESASELLALASTKKEEKAVYDCQHLAILYRYRNNLVHESREPGNGMEIFTSSGDPYYHGYIGDPKWHLVYPSLFFESLLERAITSFQTYLISNSIDPYSLVEDQARW